jgi:enolase
VRAGRRSRKAIFYEVIGDRVELVGDDLFVTNVKRIAHGIEEQVFLFLTP